MDYESTALTAELRALDNLFVGCKYCYDTSRDRDTDTGVSRPGGHSHLALLSI